MYSTYSRLMATFITANRALRAMSTEDCFPYEMTTTQSKTPLQTEFTTVKHLPAIFFVT